MASIPQSKLGPPGGTEKQPIPFDILYIIFDLGYSQEASRGICEAASFTRTVSQVCQRWRMCSLDRPTYWTNIVFASPSQCATGWPEQMAWLERSQELPLAVFIQGQMLRTVDADTEDFESEWEDPVAEGIAEFIMPISGRIRYLAVWSPREEEESEARLQSVWHFGRYIEEFNFPLLETLALQAHFVEEHTYQPWAGIASRERIPRLKTLVMENVPIGIQSALFQDLTSLTIVDAFAGHHPEYMWSNEILHFLRISPELMHFNYSVSPRTSGITTTNGVITTAAFFMNDPAFWNQQGVLHPSKIRTIEIGNPVYICIVRLLSDINLSTLEAIQVEGSPARISTFYIDHLINNPLRSIRQLCLAGYKLAESANDTHLERLEEALVHMEKLEELSLHRIRFHSLALVEVLGRVCPSLTRLHLQSCRWDGGFQIWDRVTAARIENGFESLEHIGFRPAPFGEAEVDGDPSEKAAYDALQKRVEMTVEWIEQEV